MKKTLLFLSMTWTVLGVADPMDTLQATAHTSLRQMPLVASDLDERSAVRFPGENYEDAAQRHQKNLIRKGIYQNGRQLRATVQNSQVAVANANLSRVPVWKDADIKSFFKKTRDDRFLAMQGQPAFKRRLSWLYPDDGCYTRAELVKAKASDMGLPLPYKLFSFGNLTVKTNNAPGGYVRWWYHVVPIVKSEETSECFVFDAAIDPQKPLLWKDWLLKQVGSLSSVQVAVCDPHAYAPNSPAFGGSSQESGAESEQSYTFLPKEWSRQTALGRDPQLVLGDCPPWQDGSEPEPHNDDAVKPTTRILSPAAGSTLSNTVEMSAEAADNVGVAKVSFYVDGKAVGTDAQAPYTCQWNTRSVSNGSHTLVSRAYDAAGNQADSAEVIVTVANEGTGEVDIHEVEPNDKSNQAQAIPQGSVTVLGTMATEKDVDWYTAEIGAGQVLTVNLSPNAESDYELYGYNSSVKLMARSEKGKGQMDSIKLKNPSNAPTKCYFAVNRSSGLTGSAGTYKLAFVF